MLNGEKLSETQCDHEGPSSEGPVIGHLMPQEKPMAPLLNLNEQPNQMGCQKKQETEAEVNEISQAINEKSISDLIPRNDLKEEDVLKEIPPYVSKVSVIDGNQLSD